jgi:integrase
MDVLARNVAQAVQPPKVERKEVAPPDIEAIRSILAMAGRKEHPLSPCLHLIAYTGIRRGEALGLRWQDVNLDLATISIVQTIGRSLEGLIIQPPKTNAGRRTIDIDARTVDVLRSHQGRQLLEKLNGDAAYVDNDLVFANPFGEPINPMSLTRTFQSLCKALGLPSSPLHALRHFHASVMLQQNQSPVLVSKRLGHASVATTMDVYSHVLPGWQKEAADAFAKAMEEA